MMKLLNTTSNFTFLIVAIGILIGVIMWMFLLSDSNDKVPSKAKLVIRNTSINQDLPERGELSL
ncbi:MAG: hypothetical protein PWP21_181 [Thermosediminibacterales bacterium]|nr:hypothetical protein [Thermosediminibacterales bacterium]